MSAVPRVTIVEIRTPTLDPEPYEADAERELAFVGSDRARAMAFVTENSVYRRDEYPWCWCVYDTELDAPVVGRHGELVIGRDGKIYASQDEAWAACPVTQVPGGPR